MGSDQQRVYATVLCASLPYPPLIHWEVYLLVMATFSVLVLMHVIR